MMREGLVVQEFCENAKTFEDIFKCMELSQAYAEKWNLNAPASLQSYNDAEAQFELLQKIFECSFNAKTEADLAVCENLANEYDLLYGSVTVLQQLEEENEFNEIVDTFECYLKARTPEQIEQCNNLAENTAEKVIEESTGVELEVIENQMNNVVVVMNCYMTAETNEQLAQCAELEAQLMGYQPTSF